jgi:hypothetical protein
LESFGIEEEVREGGGMGVASNSLRFSLHIDVFVKALEVFLLNLY